MKHNKGIEHYSEMPRVYLGGIEGSLIIRISIESIKPSTTDGASYLPVLPFIVPIGHKFRVRVVAIDILRQKLLAHEDDDEQNDDLNDGLTDDMFHHGFGHYVVIAAVRFSL